MNTAICLYDYTTSVILTSLLWLFDLASGLSSHVHFRSIVHNLFIHLLYSLLMNTVSRNKPSSISYGWLLWVL